MKYEFDIIKLARCRNRLFQLDLEICSLSRITRRVVNRKTSISPEAIINEAIRLLVEIDELSNEYYIQQLIINN
jgi:hypothetical protein